MCIAVLCAVILFTKTETLAQGKFKTTTTPGGGASSKPASAKQGETTVNLDQTDMMSIANGGQAGSFSAGPVNTAPVTGYQESPALQQYAEEQVSGKIFGNKTTYEYGVTYYSGPVADAYNFYIAPNITDFMVLNDEIYLGQPYKNKIAASIARMLSQLAENTGTFVSPGSRGALIVETFKQFQNDPFGDDAKQSQYYGDHLIQIFKRVVHLLKSTQDFSKSGNMMTGFAARNACAIGYLLGQMEVDKLKIDSQLTDDLYSAKWGMLFKPLTSYKNQKSGFGVHALKMSVLQTATHSGMLQTFYEKDCNCPSQKAFFIGNSVKVNSGSVISTPK